MGEVTKLKICADCKWGKPPTSFMSVSIPARCLHPETTDLVSGIPGKYCKAMRYSGACGEEGRLYEAKE